jgi:hypothetical protein
VVAVAAGAAEAEVAAGAAEAVGLPRFTAEVAAGTGVATMVAWPTWVMGGVVMHRACTAGLTRRIQHFPVTITQISVTITQVSVTITQ